MSASLTDGDVVIRNAAASLAGSGLRLAGTLHGVGGDLRLDNLAFGVDSPQPGRLARQLGTRSSTALDRLGAVMVNGTVSGNLAALTGKVQASSEGVTLAAEGQLANPLAAWQADGTVTAHADNAAHALRLLVPAYGAPAALGPLALSARLTGDGHHVQMSALDAQLGEARLTGTANSVLGDHPVVTASLAGTVIALDPFLSRQRSGGVLPPLPAGLRAHPFGRSPPLPGPAILLAAVTAAGGSGAPWSHEPLDLAVLQDFDAQVDFQAQAVSWGGWRLDDAHTRVVVEHGNAHMDHLTGKLLGGDLNADLRLDGGGQPQISGILAVAGADVSRAHLGSGAVQITQGRLDADTRFGAAGRSMADMVAKLTGEGRFAVRNGVLTGFDLPAVNKQMENLQTIGNLLGLAQAGMSGGNTRFAALTGTFRADNGVVATHDTKLDADGGTGTADATVDLPRWTIESRIALRVANGQAPPLGLRFEGPLSNPRKVIDINEIQRYMVDRGLGRALKGGGGLDGLLGNLGGKAPQGDQQQSQSGQQPSGKQILQNLFRGLGGK